MINIKKEIENNSNGLNSCLLLTKNPAVKDILTSLYNENRRILKELEAEETEKIHELNSTKPIIVKGNSEAELSQLKHIVIEKIGEHSITTIYK